VAQDGTDTRNPPKNCFDHFKTLLAYTNKRHVNFRHMLTLIFLKIYKINIKISKKYTQHLNIYLIFCWKNNIPLLEKIKFDLVIHNVYEYKLYIWKANSIS
jgi:hypothetical protein